MNATKLLTKIANKFLIFNIVLCTCLTTPTNAAQSHSVVSTIGDSITAGVGASPSIGYGNGCAGCGGYQKRLTYLLNTGNSTGTVYNHGIRGETSG